MANHHDLLTLRQPPSESAHLQSAFAQFQNTEVLAKTRLLEAIAAYVPKLGAQFLLFAACDAYAKASHRRRVAQRELEQ